uniref:hypothetical protein n=1 Tax=Teretinema zuelzerae TaxID=156 RepID=UPI0038B59C94
MTGSSMTGSSMTGSSMTGSSESLGLSVQKCMLSRYMTSPGANPPVETNMNICVSCVMLKYWF